MRYCLMVFFFCSTLHLFAQEEGNKEPDLDFIIAEDYPKFPGGDESLYLFIKKHLRWPKTSEEVEGRVFVQFYVETDGSLTDVQVVKGIGKSYDEESERVIKLMPKWEPGSVDGQITRMRMIIPVTFKRY